MFTVIDMKLVLLMMAGTAALIEAAQDQPKQKQPVQQETVADPCCYSKELGGKKYTLIESNSEEVESYGCDTANSCIYEEDGTYDRYCFKRGGQEMPTCLQALPNCDYFALATLDETNAADQKIETFGYTAADNAKNGTTDATCFVPSIPGPNDEAMKEAKLFTLGHDLVMLDYKAEDARAMKVLKLEGDSWKTHDIQDTSMPIKNYGIATSKKELYIIGGINGGGDPLKTVFKTGDGKTWEKLKWELKFQTLSRDYRFCITTNDQTGHDNLVISDKYNLIIYDLGAANPATDNFVYVDLDLGFKLPTAPICHDGWFYILDREASRKNVFSVQLSKIDPTKGVSQFMKSDPLTTQDSQLIVYNNKVGVVAGNEDTDLNEKFLYVDTTDGKLKDGGEFHLASQLTSLDKVLVPVLAK